MIGNFSSKKNKKEINPCRNHNPSSYEDKQPNCAWSEEDLSVSVGGNCSTGCQGGRTTYDGDLDTFDQANTANYPEIFFQVNNWTGALIKKLPRQVDPSFHLVEKIRYLAFCT